MCNDHLHRIQKYNGDILNYIALTESSEDIVASYMVSMRSLYASVVLSSLSCETKSAFQQGKRYISSMTYVVQDANIRLLEIDPNA